MTAVNIFKSVENNMRQYFSDLRAENNSIGITRMKNKISFKTMVAFNKNSNQISLKRECMIRILRCKDKNAAGLQK